VSAVLDLFTVVAVAAGAFFFLAGTVGLLRFPDVFTHLHALSKADNLGLGLLALGLAVGAESLLDVVHLLLVWLLVLVASATTAHLIARHARQRGVRPWTRPDR
jgi:multicomponent Na+:H+ antiporter subunit G